MRSVFTCLIFILFSNNIYAENKITRQEAVESLCDSMQGYAQSVMRNRQNGGTASESIRVINQAEGTAAIDNYMKAIVHNAYSEPRWESERNKNNAIIDFGNKIYIQCIRIHQKN